MSQEKIEIAISACLLGQRVRYDGAHKCQSHLVDVFQKQFAEQVTLIPFCPEVAIGLGVPRPKIQLFRKKDEPIRVLGVENHTLDVTDSLQSYASEFIKVYPGLRYVIVKSRSPSCGYGSTPLMSCIDLQSANAVKPGNLLGGVQPVALASGMFTQTLLDIKPGLQVVEETQLETEQLCLTFLQNLLQEKNF